MADEELKNLKAKRKQVKSKLTRFRNQFEEINKDEKDMKMAFELELRIEKVSPLWDEFNEIQGHIELLENSDDNEADIFETKYFKLISSMQTLCKDIKKLEISENASVVGSTSNSDHLVGDLQSVVKLPPIKLPTFNGHYDGWIEFKDTFTALVQNNNALSDIQRFYYLRSSLEKEAIQIIKSIEVSSSNYQIAWQMLEERFENKNLIIHNHIKAIFEHPSVYKESHVELRNLFDNVTKHLRSLNNLGLQTDTWDSLIIYIMCNKFDNVTKREWECFNAKQDLPTIKDMNNFLRKKCEILEKLEITCQEKPGKFKSRFGSRSFASINGDVSKLKCYFCQKAHPIYKCESFLKLNVNDRISNAKRLKLCLNCLRDSHATWQCKMRKCIKCQKLHNSILHLNFNANKISQVLKPAYEDSAQSVGLNETNNADVNDVVSASTSVNNHSHWQQNEGGVANSVEFSDILLSTALVRAKNKITNNSIICRALLDSGSQSNFITENVCKKLNLEVTRVNHVVKGVGQSFAKITNEAMLTLESCNGQYSLNTKCLIIPTITGKLPVKSFKKEAISIPQDIELADPTFSKSDNIDLLLGSGIFWSILRNGRRKIGERMPILQNTEFGWIIAGNLHLNYLSSYEESVTCLNQLLTLDTVNESIVKFWEIEEININTKPFSEEECYCEEYFKQSVHKDGSGKYIVKIPFKPSVNELGDSYTIALQRFNLLEKRLAKNNELKKQYTEFMSEYLSLNHMSEVELNENEGYFLPHHAVVKNESLTTKCRVVFDGSAKSSSGLSINDVQYIGPSLQNDIFQILLRFRMYKFVLSGDISKMYRQVLINPEQRRYQKILWRSHSEEKLKCYELNTVTYGTASAPYLAVRTLLQVAIDNEKQYPLIAKIINQDFYMDDLLTGSDSRDEIIEIQKTISEVLASSGFELRKWLCNNEDIMTKFKINERLDVAMLQFGEQNKTLGIFWDAKGDCIKYNINIDANKFAHQWNKRTILSLIGRIYDPLGLLGPVVINAKLIMQDLWKKKIGWDQALPTDIHEKWLTYYNSMTELKKIMIPRHATLSNYICLELHGFSDSSMKAYGCCIFLKCLISSGKCTSHLLCAKSRVAPLKLISLPRLELCGAVLLANLIKKVISSLNVNLNAIYCWTDSTICLYWIRGEPSRWKQFVANRVQEIQNLTDPKWWNHVKSEYNPADLLSRGVSVNDLLESKLWWNGPDWILEKKETWNIFEVVPPHGTPLEEKTTVLVSTNTDNLINELLNRYSSFNKYLRILAYALRFIFNSKLDKGRKAGLLQLDELENALTVTLKCVQKECFALEYAALLSNKNVSCKSKILSLNPFLHNQLLRVGGRLNHSDIPFNSKHQIILPSSHILTRKILQTEHERLLHCGVQHLMFSIRQTYWPISARNSCKYIIKQCIPCFRARPKVSNYLMGNLPGVRVNSFSVFENVGTDYGGPFNIKIFNTRTKTKTTKAYICLFICMCTKAVHIELVSDLTTDAFLATLRRFISRRGKPSNIYSDNGSNYIGANNELKKIYKFLQINSDFILENLRNEKIKWHFIPAKSPTFGGLWEAGIKSIKSHLCKTMGNRSLTFEEFSTLLAQVEGILNSRPLCPMSSDPDDNTALSPAHFLIGKTLTMLPEYDLSSIPENRLDKWQKLQSLTQQLWSRWKKEYLQELQVRQKWKVNASHLLKTGSMVLVREDNTPPLQWPLGRISALHPGPDGIVRVVTVRMRGSEIKRSVTRICVLPIDT